MPKFPFVGPTYPARSTAISVQECMNLYPELVDGAEEDHSVVLIGAPGKQLFVELLDGPHRGALFHDNRAFCVAGTTLFEVFRDGSYADRGQMANDDGLATMWSNGTAGDQIGITTGHRLYVFTLSTNTLTRVSDADLPYPITMGDFHDGYGIILKGASRQFNTSELEDFTAWDGLDLYERSRRGDDLRALKMNGLILFLLGSKTGEVWRNTGAAIDPWQPIEGAFLEHGIGAGMTLQKWDGTVAWLVESEHGDRMLVAAAQGYQPVRLSNHAIETHWKTYSRVDDAEAFAYQEDGHTFYQITFPAPSETWVLDASTKMWHRRGRFLNGLYTADKARTHMKAWGKHLVGDRYSGKLFEQSTSFYDDAGDVLRSLRRCQRLGTDNEFVYLEDFELFMQPAAGLVTGQGSDPEIMFRISRDGGNTWAPERRMRVGKIGKYLTRAYVSRLGRAINPVIEVAMSDPVKRVWTAATLGAGGGE